MSSIPSYIWLTLVASVLHAFSFTYTKQFLAHSDNRVKLAFYSQYAVGLVAFCLLPWVDLNQLWANIELIVLMCGFILIAQTSYLNALRHGDASFVVPMLGCKMFAVAGLSVLFLNETYSPIVYLGAAGAFASLFFLNDGKLHGSPKALGFVLLTCMLFAFADIAVVLLLNKGMGGLDLAVFVFIVPTVLLMPLSPIIFKRDWQVSKPFGKTLFIYAVVQLVGIIILMVAFKQAQQVTVINIVQSSRGLIAVGVVYLMARFGFSHIERLSKQQLINRSFGGVLMFVSLAVAVLGLS
ncbi:MAG: EamA family transporter [Cycloclasticus sp.]|jgi:drug/metabolite transporter (DMT)-like permease